ncbi:hypothetical protein QYM36_012542 [Artemia franciscana]|uniref:Uncharacterized protein n=1 Tax=Artemia franciscana TaxID=6661 RepID=A0AA88HV36_ARTSF|nr:hypothetical protein QYM36_012542 [Artemia franciscana]
MMKGIHQHFYEKAKVMVNIKVEAKKQQNSNEVKEKPIPGIKNIGAVASSKGCVLKSTVTANLAVSMTKMGFKIGLLDADIYGPSGQTMFDVLNERLLSVLFHSMS